jgi:hypothetical protein
MWKYINIYDISFVKLVVGFVFSNLLVGCQLSQEALVDFGYKSQNTLEEIRIVAIFWWHVGTCCLNMAISMFVSSKYGYFGPFFSKKSCIGFSFYFFGVTKWQKNSQ